jgi:hypothetical protein
MKQMKNDLNFLRRCGNSGNGSHLRGKTNDFCEMGLWQYYYRNTNAVTQLELVHIVGASRPQKWPATRTDSDVPKGFFFSWRLSRYPHLDEVPDLKS